MRKPVISIQKQRSKIQYGIRKSVRKSDFNFNLISMSQIQLLNKLMAFFHNLNKLVPGQLFMKSNSFLLNSRYRPVFLQTGGEQRIEHVHSVKALIKTIQELESLRSQQDWAPIIQRKISFYQGSLFHYVSHIRNFVKKGGLLTGEGIGNIYFSADKLFLSTEWLQRNVHHEVILKYKNMTRQNLIDTIAGLKKYHEGSPYLNQLEAQLASRPQTKPQYVKHLYNEAVRFQYADNCKSNNILINTILSGRPKYLYNVYSVAGFILSGSKQALHSE